MLFTDLLRLTVLLVAGEATALGAIAVVIANREDEVIVVGYLLRRLDRLGWSPGVAMAGSSVLRGSYHLYQGIGGFIGNMVMGVVFVYLYRRWGRVGPLVVAHALLDIGAFVGYALLAGKVGWLPTP